METFKAQQAAVAAVAHGLTPAELAKCKYHATDWVTAAEVAVGVLEGRETMDEAIERLGDTTREAEGVWSLLSREPVWLDGPQLGNGQHRVCAMKLAGAKRCPVEL